MSFSEKILTVSIMLAAVSLIPGSLALPAVAQENDKSQTGSETASEEFPQQEFEERDRRDSASQESAQRGQQSQIASQSDETDNSNETNKSDETEVLRAVVRVSWRLIDRLADDQIQADVPFESDIMGGQMSGRVQSRANITIELDELPESAQFRILAEGTARGNYRANRDRIYLAGPMSIPFRSEKVVQFDGRNFTAGQAEVETDIQVDFNCIQWGEGGLGSRLGTRLITPAVLRERPQIESNAEPLAQDYLTKFVDKEMSELVKQLNQVSEVEESVLRVYPQLQDWKIRLRSTEDHLEARFAPSGSEQLTLPDDPKRPQNAGFELWIRTTEAEARFLERLGGWDQTQQLLKDAMQDQDVSVREMASDAKIVAIDNWVVVALGKDIVVNEETVAPQE